MPTITCFPRSTTSAHRRQSARFRAADVHRHGSTGPRCAAQSCDAGRSARSVSSSSSPSRERAGQILDGLPRDETFNWVDRVSIELTTQMLATLFDFPFEERHLLPYWSDVTTASDVVGVTTLARKSGNRSARVPRLFHAAMERERSSEPAHRFHLPVRPRNRRGICSRPMEFLGNLMLLIVGGNDTTRNSISGGVVALNNFPEQYDKLREDPSLIPTSSRKSSAIRRRCPTCGARAARHGD